MLEEEAKERQRLAAEQTNKQLGRSTNTVPEIIPEASSDNGKSREHYGTFEEYCRERWGFSDRHARRLMDSAEVITNLKSGPIGPVLPTVEAQARPLTRLEPDIQRQAWTHACADRPSILRVGGFFVNVSENVRPY